MDYEFQNAVAQTLGRMRNESSLRGVVYDYYCTNQKFKADFDQYTYYHYNAMLANRANPNTAFVESVNAVSLLMVVKLSESNAAVAHAFATDREAEYHTKAIANQANNLIVQYEHQLRTTRQQGGYSTGYDQQDYMAGAFASSQTSTMMPGMNNQVSHSGGVTLPVQNSTPMQTNEQYVNTTQTAVNVEVVPDNVVFGLPKMHNRQKEIVSYVAIKGKDAYTTEKTMDPRTHNINPAYLVQPSQLGYNAQQSHALPNDATCSLWVHQMVNESDGQESALHTRQLVDAEGHVVYCFVDVTDSGTTIYLNEMPTIEMVTLAHRVNNGLGTSAVWDTLVVEKIIPNANAHVIIELMQQIKESTSAIDLASRLSDLISQHCESVDDYVAYNAVGKAYISAINRYLGSCWSKANLPSSIIEGLDDVEDLVDKYIKPNDKLAHFTFSDTTAFQHWLNHRFIVSNYEDTDHFTIESRRPLVYTTLAFDQFELSFVANCDKAILTEEDNPWLYSLFTSHLPKKEGPRPMQPIRYYTKDGVKMDVTPINLRTGMLLVKLVD